MNETPSALLIELGAILGMTWILCLRHDFLQNRQQQELIVVIVPPTLAPACAPARKLRWRLGLLAQHEALQRHVQGVESNPLQGDRERVQIHHTRSTVTVSPTLVTVCSTTPACREVGVTTRGVPGCRPWMRYRSSTMACNAVSVSCADMPLGSV